MHPVEKQAGTKQKQTNNNNNNLQEKGQKKLRSWLLERSQNLKIYTFKSRMIDKR